MTNLLIGLVEVQKVPLDVLFSYEGMIFRKHFSDDLFTYCFCLIDKGFYVIFNDTLVNIIEKE